MVMQIKFVQKEPLSAIDIMSISIGVIYFWFGILKFFHGYSPAEQIAIATIDKLTFHLIPGYISLFALALWECAIGCLFVLRRYMKLSLLMLFVHLFFTFTPLIFFPTQIFTPSAYAFTLLGQYIMKNIVIIACGAVMWQHYIQHNISKQKGVNAAETSLLNTAA
jgi:uncharacterized membrane protein YkgB